MASSTGIQIGATKRRDAFELRPEDITIEQEGPTHADHGAHMARVSLHNPKFKRLLDSMRAIGWETGSVAFVHRKKGVLGCFAADGKRRITASRIVNKERRAAGRSDDDLITVLAILTDEGDTAESIANSNREDDPILVRARRYLKAKRSLSDVEAAAQNGLTVKEAHQAVQLLSADPEMQDLLNGKVIPVDVAIRMLKKGAAAVREQLNAARDESGSVDPAKLRGAARKVSQEAIEAGKTNGVVQDEAEVASALDALDQEWDAEVTPNPSDSAVDVPAAEALNGAANGAPTGVPRGKAKAIKNAKIAAAKKKLRLMPRQKFIEVLKVLKKEKADSKIIAFCEFLLGKKSALNDHPKLRNLLVPEES
jgi:hypothetical protein